MSKNNMSKFWLILYYFFRSQQLISFVYYLFLALTFFAGWLISEGTDGCVMYVIWVEANTEPLIGLILILAIMVEFVPLKFYLKHKILLIIKMIVWLLIYYLVLSRIKPNTGNCSNSNFLDEIDIGIAIFHFYILLILPITTTVLGYITSRVIRRRAEIW